MIERFHFGDHIARKFLFRGPKGMILRHCETNKGQASPVL
jgi:hypothetical protein